MPMVFLARSMRSSASLLPILAPAPFPHLLSQRLLGYGADLLGSGIAGEEVASRLALHIFQHCLEFGEDDEDELLELIEQRRLLADVPFPRIVQPSQVRCVTFGNNDRQGSSQAYDIGDHPGVLIVRLQRRVVVDLLHLLRVHGIHLDHGDRLTHKILGERFRIRTRRFITRYDLITAEPVLAGHDHVPEFLKPLSRVVKLEGLYVAPVSGGAIARVARHTNIYRHQ